MSNNMDQFKHLSRGIWLFCVEHSGVERPWAGHLACVWEMKYEQFIDNSGYNLNTNLHGDFIFAQIYV